MNSASTPVIQIEVLSDAPIILSSLQSVSGISSNEIVTSTFFCILKGLGDYKKLGGLLRLLPGYHEAF